MSFTIPPPSGIGEAIKYRKTPIYSQPPHIVCDNHFSGDNMLDYAGRKGYGITQTMRRDRYPEGLAPYLHHDKVLAGDPRAKAMRFMQPIVAIKQVEETNDQHPTKAYTKTLVSFQSTGATNISGVNNLPSAGLYVSVKS